MGNPNRYIYIYKERLVRAVAIKGEKCQNVPGKPQPCGYTWCSVCVVEPHLPENYIMLSADKNHFAVLMWLILVIHSLSDEHLGYFHFLVMVNRTETDRETQVSLWLVVLFGLMPKSSIAAYYGGSVFRYLKNVHTNFHRHFTSLNSN